MVNSPYPEMNKSINKETKIDDKDRYNPYHKVVLLLSVLIVIVLTAKTIYTLGSYIAIYSALFMSNPN